MTSSIVILTALLQTLALLAFVWYAITHPTSEVEQATTEDSFASLEVEVDVTTAVCAPPIANILSSHVQLPQGSINESSDAPLASEAANAELVIRLFHSNVC